MLCCGYTTDWHGLQIRSFYLNPEILTVSDRSAEIFCEEPKDFEIRNGRF